MTLRFESRPHATLPGLLLVGFGLLSAVPCTASAAPSAEDRVRSKQQAVLDGQPSNRQAVVFVTAHQDGFLPAACSGALVAPNIVVTALHCVSEYVPGDYTCDLEGFVNESYGRDPTDAGRLGAPFQPEGIAIHTSDPVDSSQIDAIGRKVIAPQTESICRSDLAFVILDRDLDIEYLPLRVGKGLTPGETVMVAGYGISETPLVDRNERAGLLLEGVGPSTFYSVKGQAPPGTFAVGQGPCPGDSGGPAISDKTGEVIGVFSFWSGEDCSNPLVRAFYTQVAVFEPFLLRAFEEAGHLDLVQPPVTEPPPPAVGGAGSEPAPIVAGDAGSSGAATSEPKPEKPTTHGGCSWSPTSARSLNNWLALACFGLLPLLRRRRPELD